jgi:signal transduction histidine kinase
MKPIAEATARTELLLVPGDEAQGRIAAALRADFPLLTTHTGGVSADFAEHGPVAALVRCGTDGTLDLELLRALRIARPRTPVVLILPCADATELAAGLPQELDYYPVDAETDPAAITLLLRTILRRQQAPFAASGDPQSAVAELERSRIAFRELHSITTDPAASFQEKLERTLQLGVAYFGLRTGIVSHIVGETYEVFASTSAGGDGIPAGTLFPLPQTYCERTIGADRPVGFEHAAKSEWHAHPAYRLLRLEAYIGMPLRVGGQLFGTLNFSSPEPTPGVFRPLNVELLKVMARWIGAELLRQAHEERLRRMNAELEEFAYVASHDLKAPLRGVANLALWIAEDVTGLDDENRARLKLLRERIIQMDRLIDGLLEYSRLGNVDPAAYAPVPLAPLLASLRRELPPPEGFTITVEEPLPALAADPLHLRQLFQNLISNAVQHHDLTEGHIVVRAQDAGESWQIEVADDGPGIPPAQRQAVFKMFYTVGPKRRPEQIGIGLALVRKLVVGYGGRVTLGDNAPRGTVVQIFWPKI